jgi:CBS domain-containing protein
LRTVVFGRFFQPEVNIERTMRIREIMNKPVVSCRPSDTLNVAAQAMWEHDCGAIPVAGDDGRLVGIITDRDICMATYTKSRAPQTISVAEVMAKRVTSCKADESAEVAEGMMRDKQIRRVPIVDDDNRPIGMLSQSDLARNAASAPRRNTVERDFIHTMASISQPRLRAIEMSPPAKPETRVSETP